MISWLTRTCMRIEPAPMVAGSHMTLHKPTSVPRTLGDRTHNKPGEVRAAEALVEFFFFLSFFSFFF